MDFNHLTLQEMRYLYAVKTHELETLLDNYWAGAPEDLENSPSVKEQVRQLGHEIQELERLMAERKSQFPNPHDSNTNP
ncbi:MAG: hypothetical protein K9N34_07150 [Candidatus Marinimicrobia bacterium]|nr:hypothetical protein [Candidatus Neomarinimicrobiota bacterium]MCF7840756.1 hypothetical protein [Candidatus Neomarinimicrobiota bacterium]MCF7902696.1 hypothetical protein [Candidatus Neomarinimicrobiota bacterium]